jgi:hypothetical protein
MNGPGERVIPSGLLRHVTSVRLRLPPAEIDGGRFQPMRRTLFDDVKFDSVDEGVVVNGSGMGRSSAKGLEVWFAGAS